MVLKSLQLNGPTINLKLRPVKLGLLRIEQCTLVPITIKDTTLTLMTESGPSHKGVEFSVYGD